MSELEDSMNNLNVNEGGRQSKSNYVPPHRRNGQGSSAFANNGSRGGGFGGRGRDNFSAGRGGGRNGMNFRGGRGRGPTRGQGRWVQGKHVPAPKDEELELKMFGTPEDPSFQSSGLNFDNYDDIPVEATGEDVPEPITQFTSPPLDELLLENIKLSRFTKPTPVQKYSVPIVSNHRDLMACAQTGSGKTGGFLFPVLSECFQTGPAPIEVESETVFRKHRAYPTILVMAPTRELVSQIYDEAKKFAYRSWMRPCVVYGGANIRDQMEDLILGCDLLVATPGRLSDLLERGKISLAKIKYLILDEADRMLDMGFEPQIRHIVQGCDMPSVNERHTLMFSATFPRDIQLLAKDFLKDYIFLSVGRVGSTSENITQRVLSVEDDEKKSVLLDILSSSDDIKEGLTLIFVETKRMADTLSHFLVTRNFPATSIHGDRTQQEREHALHLFKSGAAPILVATAVAARGLDIPNVTHVVNYDLPADIDDYVHRIGRTGRAGNVGIATAFVNRGNKNLIKGLIELLTEANQEVPQFLSALSREATVGRGGARGGRGGRNAYGKDFRRSSNYPPQPSSQTYGRANGGSGYFGGSNFYGSAPSSNTTQQSSGSDWW
ncbi:DEAD-box ATP-dependent RNA helicase [Komagataella kurtzmanii]|nr:DEAD-box ATP-dependent RNA helicase [Komagataella kurtzmanii]